MRSRRLVLAALAAVVAVATSGCASVQPELPQARFDLPADFAASSEQGYAACDVWWISFDDPQLKAFIDIALVDNPDLAQALAQVRIAEAQARLSRADQLPQVGLGLGTTRQRQNLVGATGQDATVISTSHSAALDVSWELDLWGRLSALSASARADYLASSEQLRSVRQSIAAQAAQLYFQIVEAKVQVELARSTVETLEEIARQINNRVAVGVAAPPDDILATSNLESAKAGLQQRIEALERSLRQLQVLMGEYPSGNVQSASALPEVPPAPAAGVPAGLLARRPDVRAAELSLLSAGYRLTAAERSFLPSLSLTGSAGSGAAELADLFSSGNFIWSIAGRALQPIFQGGRLTAQVDIAEGRIDEALSAYAETALGALAEVETALAVDSLLVRREAALDAAATAAEEAMQVSLNRYLQGIDPFLTVLESQQRALDARSAQFSARNARLENRIALHLALGGGFEETCPPISPAAASATPLSTHEDR